MRYEEMNKIITPVYTFLPQMDQKRFGPHKKNPQNDEYVFFQLKNKNIFPQSAIFQELKYIYTTNRF